MRRILIIITTGSLICCSSGITCLWIGENGTNWIEFNRIAFIIYLIGILLFLVACLLYILRGMLLHRYLGIYGINLSFLDMFRRIESARPYQRDFWLQIGIVGSTLPLIVLLAFLINAILYKNLFPSISNFLVLQNKGDLLGPYLGMTAILIFPLSMLLYTLVSKDITDILNKDRNEEIFKK